MLYSRCDTGGGMADDGARILGWGQSADLSHGRVSLTVEWRANPAFIEVEPYLLLLEDNGKVLDDSRIVARGFPPMSNDSARHTRDQTTASGRSARFETNTRHIPDDGSFLAVALVGRSAHGRAQLAELGGLSLLVDDGRGDPLRFSPRLDRSFGAVMLLATLRIDKRPRVTALSRCFGNDPALVAIGLGLSNGWPSPPDVSPSRPAAMESEIGARRKGGIPPRPAAPEVKIPALDRDRLRRIEEETVAVEALLSEIFAGDNYIEAAQPAGIGLDQAHRTLLAALVEAGEMDMARFSAIAKDGGLLPSGAVETINDWAFDTIGEAAIEDDGATFRVCAGREAELAAILAVK
jgi:hypothetical protein